MTCLCARCASLPFSFLPNKRPMEDLIPFFFGCLCRESWLLATLLRALVSASREATILRAKIKMDNASEKERFTSLIYKYLSRKRTLVHRCAWRLAVCASFVQCAASEEATSRIWWWPCPLGHPPPRLLSEGRGRRGATWIRNTWLQASQQFLHGAITATIKLWDLSVNRFIKCAAACTFLLCFLKSLGCRMER